jgi:hypothetical protein
LHLDLLHIVFVYLEVTAVTLLFFALLYQQFGIFDLFRYNGTDAVRHMLAMRPHSFRVALYISMELFTTLGLGDWIPRTPSTPCWPLASRPCWVSCRLACSSPC